MGAVTADAGDGAAAGRCCHAAVYTNRWRYQHLVRTPPASLSPSLCCPLLSPMPRWKANAVLADRALAVYDAIPGLESNAITHLMSRQLGIARLPSGACAQQRLHHIW